MHLEWPPDSAPSVFSAAWLRRHAYWWDGPPPEEPPPHTRGVSEGVESALARAWWRDEALDKRTRAVWRPSTLPNHLPPSLPYSAWMGSEGGLLQGLRLLRDYGFVVLQGAPVSEEATEAACLRLGFLRPTLYGPGMWRTEVRGEEAPPAPTKGGDNTPPQGCGEKVTDTAYTSSALALHTDGNYLRDPPGLQVFHCTQPDAGGGGWSLLADGLAVAEEVARLDPGAFRLLTLWPLPYHHTGVDGRVTAARPVFELDEGGEVCGMFFNNDDRGPVVTLPSWGREAALATALLGGKHLPSNTLSHPSTAIPALYSALRVLQGVLRNPGLALRLSLQPGNILIFNNHRVLHGREAFGRSSGRTLVGCYLGADEWQSKIREAAAAVAVPTPTLS